MPSYILGRIVSLVLSLIAASIVIFLVLEVVPGDPAQFMLDYRALAASNAARILGRVFARQTLLGRPQYRAFMPRTWRYLERNLQEPAMAGLKSWFDRHVPPGDRA